MKPSTVALCALALCAGVFLTTRHASAQPVDRAAFARRLSGVRRNMTAAQVRSVMGAPEDTLTRIDPELAPASIVTELWSWGASQHGAFPSLGSVGFTAQGRVFDTHGGQAPASSPRGVGEAQLRALFAGLATLPRLMGDGYDPRPVIRVVNALRPLGARTALDVIAEYLRVAPQWSHGDTEGVFYVLRTLFAPPPSGAHPPMAVGAPTLTPPNDATTLPSFPLVIVDDIPLMLVGGYMLGGAAEPPSAHLPWYRANGVLRAAPLAPSATALDAFAHFEGGAAGRALPTAQRAGLRSMLMEQLLRLVEDAYRPTPVARDEHFASGTDPTAQWARMTTEFARAGARWDAAQGRYAASGVAAAARPARMPRTRWEYNQRGLYVEVLLERRSNNTVQTWVHFERRGPGPVMATGHVDVVASVGRAPLRRIPITSGMLGAYSVGDVSLALGAPVIVHIDHAGTTTDSPALTQ